jgi:hypothetical protein
VPQIPTGHRWRASQHHHIFHQGFESPLAGGAICSAFRSATKELGRQFTIIDLTGPASGLTSIRQSPFPHNQTSSVRCILKFSPPTASSGNSKLGVENGPSEGASTTSPGGPGDTWYLQPLISTDRHCAILSIVATDWRALLCANFVISIACMSAPLSKTYAISGPRDASDFPSFVAQP